MKETKRTTDRRIGRFTLRADRAIANSPRTRLVGQYLEWIESAQAKECHATSELLKQLPDGIRVRVRDKRTLPGGNLGTFHVGSPAVPARAWEINIAALYNLEDSIEVESWLATIPHELYHLAQFCKRSKGRVPADLSLEEFRALVQPENGEEVAAERFARFAMEHEFDEYQYDLLLEDDLCGDGRVKADPGTEPETRLAAATRRRTI